jgi:hypothetical protein
LAGVKRPSFLKRQKEQRRKAKASGKRDARAARKQAKADGEIESGPEFGSLQELLGLPSDEAEVESEESEESGEGGEPAR